jgi:transcriptional regulator of arginine metabolism
MHFYGIFMRSVMEKQKRRQRILKLVHDRAITSQQELATLLEQQGFCVTQATLSRELRELNLVKTPLGYKLPSDLNQPQRSINSFRQSVSQFMVNANVASNLVVVKTHPGGASPLAISLDASAWNEIVGTIAGDDTVLVVTPTPRAARNVQRRLIEITGNPH